MNLFLDIETSGLPGKGLDWRKDYDKFPYILSVAFGSNGSYREYYLDNGIEIPKEITSINDIDLDTIKEKGVPAKVGLKIVVIGLGGGIYEKIIGHNLYFDSSIIKANVLRYFGTESHEAKMIESALHKDKRICTMRMAQKKFGGRYMSLIDLHKKLFGEGFDAHKAMQDVLACERCYNKMI